MNSNTVKIVVAVIASAVLWLLGVFFLSHTAGMICVMLGITIAGYVAGEVMNTPEPSAAKP